MDTGVALSVNKMTQILKKKIYGNRVSHLVVDYSASVTAGKKN